MSLQIINDTPFEHKNAIVLDTEANQIWVSIIKAKYHIGNEGFISLAEKQEKVCLSAEYSGEAGSSDMVRESEICFEHPGTDIIANALAWSPDGEYVKSIKVRETAIKC